MRTISLIAFLMFFAATVFGGTVPKGSQPTLAQGQPLGQSNKIEPMNEILHPQPAPGTVLEAGPPKIGTSAAIAAPFSKDFIQSVFPSSHKPGLMTIANKTLVCHGTGTQGGQYACYAAAGQTELDCFLDRYINETPIAQKCGVVSLPSSMTKPETDERTISK